MSQAHMLGIEPLGEFAEPYLSRSRGNRKSGVGSFGTRVKLDAGVGSVRDYEIRIIAIGRENNFEHNAAATRFLERHVFCTRHVSETLRANSKRIESAKNPGSDAD